MSEQIDFTDLTNDPEKEWEGMPEYNNVNTPPPAVEVLFRFRTVADFEEFHEFVKEQLYGGQRVFDGMQRKDKKSTWFPLKEKAGGFKYK